MLIDYFMGAAALVLALIAIVTFPQIVRDACVPEPPILTPAARKFCRMLYEANRPRGSRLQTPPGYLRPKWAPR